MLIICNGVFKSGSTWLHAVILEVLHCHRIKLKAVPIKYTNNVNSPTTIVESQLSGFLDNEDYIKNHYITKSHYYRTQTIFRDYDANVYFFFVERDVKDAIVSHYHHFKKKYNFIKGFSMYYLLIGRLKAFEILDFNRKYRKAFGEDNFFQYSQLKNNFEEAVCKISSILNLPPLSAAEILRIKKNTSIAKMRSNLSSGKTKYYSTILTDRAALIRKGEEGDWVNYFSGWKYVDIKNIEGFKILPILRILYFVLFTIRRSVFKIE